MVFKASPIYIVLLFCSLTIYVLFNIKENVTTIRSELIEVNHQIQYEMDTIHLLQAELTYLGSPARLKKLNDKYVGLTDTKITQVAIDPLAKNTMKPQLASNVKIAKSVKWNYKKTHGKYMTTVSHKQ